MKGDDAEVKKRQARQASAVFPPQKSCLKRRITVRMVIPPGAAKSELLYPEIFQRCRNLERDDKRSVRRKVWQSARSHRFKSSQN